MMSMKRVNYTVVPLILQPGSASQLDTVILKEDLKMNLPMESMLLKMWVLTSMLAILIALSSVSAGN